MLRSFDYVCYSALADRLSGMVLKPEESARLRNWMRFWTAWTGAAFFKSYLAVAKGQAFVPQSPENVQVLLDVVFPGEIALRTGLRIEQPPRLGSDPLARHSCNCWNGTRAGDDAV